MAEQSLTNQWLSNHASPRYYQSNEPIILICVFVKKQTTNPSLRVRSWPWRLRESEIQVQGNQRFFSSRCFATRLRRVVTLPRLKKNLWDQGMVVAQIIKPEGVSKTRLTVFGRQCFRSHFTEFRWHWTNMAWNLCSLLLLHSRSSILEKYELYCFSETVLDLDLKEKTKI